MTARAIEPLTGVRKAAILCLALGTEQAASILKQLTPSEVERVTEEIARIPAVSREVISQVVEEYLASVDKVSQVADGGIPAAQSLLEAALGTERARAAVERITSPTPITGLPSLTRATPQVVIGLLRGEQPQTIAMVLAHVDQALAAGVLAALPAELAGQVLHRMATLAPISAEVLEQVEKVLGGQATLTLSASPSTVGGPAAVARVLNRVGGGRDQALLEGLAAIEPDLANEVRDLMFVFEDLQLLDDRGLQRLLRDVPGRELALALKAASEALKAKVFRNMSERAVETLREEMEMLGAVKVKDVQAAHASILSMARSLQEAGEITIDRGGDSDTIA